MRASGALKDGEPAVHEASRYWSVGTRGKFRAYVLTGSCIAFIAALLAFLINAKIGINVSEFGDETEYLVAAQMIVQGFHLYKDILMQHGPVPLMMAHLYAAAIDKSDFSYFRVAQILLATGSCVAVMMSPVLKTFSARAISVALYLALLSNVWLQHWLNMVLYQSIGGYLFVIMLAQCVLPLYFRENVTPTALFIGGAAFALAGFAAYPFFVIGLLFVSSYLLVSFDEPGILRTRVRPFLIGAVTVTAVVMTWLAVFGDIPGYLIYHIYFNQEIYSQFIEYSPGAALGNFPLSLEHRNLPQITTVAFLGIWLIIYIKLGVADQQRRTVVLRVASVVLLACGVVLTNPRGDLFLHNAPFLITNFALLSIAAALLLQRRVASISALGTAGIFASSVIAVLMMLVAVELAAPGDAVRTAADLKPEKSETYEFIRSITKEDGDVLALPYYPIVYIRAGRLPASGAFFYLPWHAAYAKNPFPGYRLDICSDIRRKRPTVIWFTNWRVWNKYPLEMHEPCILALIASDYAPMEFNSLWYVRKDVLAKHIEHVPRDTSGLWIDTLKRSSLLNEKNTVRLTMTTEHLARSLPLRRIGILFASSTHQIFGEAALTLTTADGAEFSTRFNLSTVSLDEYRYFDVHPNVYKGGALHAISGGGIGVWEGHGIGVFGLLEQVSTCMIYEYEDGLRGYTPSCPIADSIRRKLPESALLKGN
jgi:hypothetical protein